ncbi:MAG: FHA domain-containing protein [Planctomycetes bacterium]|nr:FHA domain-containing protein [Planctomycetota bacterium]
MPRIVHTENGVTREYPLLGEPVTVGRAARHTIPTLDARASRDHFKVELLQNRFVVTDMGSRNGTLVNGQPISGPQPLAVGDRIMIGAAVFQFMEGEAAPSAPPPEVAAVPTATGDLRADPEIPRSPTLLVLVTEGAAGQSWPITTAGIVIGRGKACDVPLPNDEKLSSRHVEVALMPDGVKVTDQKSTNGTKFKGERIDSVLLKDGQDFEAGTQTFRISDPRTTGQAPREAPAAPAKPRRPLPILAAVIAAAAVLSVAGIFAPSLLRKFFPQSAPVPHDPSNLIPKNASLEDPNLDGWTVKAADGRRGKAEATVDTQVFKDGGASLRLRGLDTREESFITASTGPIPIEAGAVYRLEGWVRASGLEGRAGFRIEWLKDGAPAGTSPTELLGEGFDWKSLAVSAAPPPGADAMRASCLVAGVVGLVWFDAVKLAKSPDPVTGARWNTPWGGMSIDSAGFVRADGPGGALLWNGEFRIVPRDPPEIPFWLGANDGEPQSVGNGYRIERRLLSGNSVVLIAVHTAEEENFTWTAKGSADAGAALSFSVDPAALFTGLTTRCGELLEVQNREFSVEACSEILFGNFPSLMFDAPASAEMAGNRLTLRWTAGSPTVVRLKAAPSWIEREVRSLVADANAAYKAGSFGKALILFQDLAKRYPDREESKEAAKKLAELKERGSEAVKNASRETDMAKKYPSNANTKKAAELIGALEREFEGTEFASEAIRLRKELFPDEKPPDPPPDGSKPPVKPPEKEPVENARKLLAWAEEAFGKEEYLKAEIYCRNVIDRWPGTAEEMKAGEILGRVTQGARAARERDGWIRETLTKARNLVKNGQREKAVPMFEEVLQKYPSSPLVKGVREELDKVKR